MGERSTPLANAFFRMVIMGGALAVLITAAVYLVDLFHQPVQNISGLPAAAAVSFFLGLVVAAAGAAPAIGMHTLASATVPKLRIPATALGAVAGPVGALAIVVGEWPANVPIAAVWWISFLVVAPLGAIYFTRPLRTPASTQNVSGPAEPADQ